MATRVYQEQVADALIGLGVDDSGSFLNRVRARLDEEGLKLPTVVVDYRNLVYTCAGASAKDAIPGLASVLVAIIKQLGTCMLRTKKETQQLTILNDISGQLQPGRLTLLLGPPSCGKSTFLRTLVGRGPPLTSGSVKWNDHAAHEFCLPRSAVFVAQVDSHIPNLTARETAEFAHTMQNSAHGSEFKAGAALAAAAHSGSSLPTVSPLSESKPAAGTALKRTSSSESAEPVPVSTIGKSWTEKHVDALVALMLDGSGRPDLVMHMFGLANCGDTWVGNAMMRGISGGERKRLSTVEMLMAQQRLFVLDEISTGLDSATLFTVIRWLRAICHNLSTTTIISLLQPPPEVFALFDDVILMAEGIVVYHGAIGDAVPFFAQFGFDLPPRKDLPSYLQELMTVQGQVMYSSLELKHKHRLPASIDPFDEEAMADLPMLVSLQEMIAALPHSPAGQAYAHGLANPALKSKAGLIPTEERSALGALASLKAVLARQRKLVTRDKSLVKARLGQCVVIGLIIGSLFYHLQATPEAARTYFGAVFMAVMFLAFGGMPQLAVTLQNRLVWFKQRDCNMYSALSYAWSMSFVQFPISILESFLFSTLVYFLIGFSTDSAGYFFIWFLILTLVSLAVTSIFRMIGCFFHDMAVANAVAGFTLLMLVVNSGYVIVHGSIPPWVIYCYWVSPFAYAMRALAINEMTSPRWGAPSLRDPTKTVGQEALAQFDFYDDRMWIWIGAAYLVFFFVLTTSLAAVGLSWLNPPARKVVIHTKEEVKAARIAARKAKLAAQAFVAKHPREMRPSIDMVAAANAAADGEVSQRRSTMSSNGLAVARTLDFTPISVVWRDIKYYVTVPKGLTGPAAANIMGEDCGEKELIGKKRLLNGLTGHARPGVLTALMGGSGAGKTTLMDILAGRKTQGIITGELLVNGHPKEQTTWSRVVGYVEQTDVHSAGLTVEESLRFSAGLRLAADISPELRAAYVEEVLVVTELLDIRSNMVGAPGQWGLSVEQRRRLSIGVEIVANPSVVFMDEPTSGLDARAAQAVMAAVRNVAGNGRTVMVTIHQPSIEIFEQFDVLVLLGMGGLPIFFGKLGVHSENLVKYFEAIPGVPKLPRDYNPATWMLEVFGGAAKMHVESIDADFHALYLASDLAARTAAQADMIVEADRKAHGRLTQSTRYAVGTGVQTRQLIWKHSLLYWRDPGYSLGRLFISVVTSLIFGLTFFRAGKLPTDRPIDISDLQDILGSVYSGLSFMGMTNLIMGVPAFTAERQVSYRERASSMYAVLPLGIATGVVEVPYLLIQSAIFTPIVYFMIGFKPTFEAVIIYFVIFACSISLYTYMGQLFTYLMPSPALATVLGGLNHFLWNIFNGFLITNPKIPAGWLWMNYISATTWVIYGLGASQLGDVHEKAVVPGYPGCSVENLGPCPTVSQWVEDYFGYKYSFRWWCVIILLGFVVLFRVSAMIVLKVINHQHR